MKRYGIYLIPLLIVIVTMTLIPSTGSSLNIQLTKHDLSYRPTNTVPIMAAESGNTTTEICVFCHTPHHSRTDAPLWNRSFSGASYETYTSDVLAAMGYPGAENPNVGAVHVKTRICLSCHDGMIALGSLVNAPYGLSGDIDMQGGVTTMPTTAQGYIGTDLRDDHPVAIPHISGSAPGQDPELRGTVGGDKVYLYTLISGKVEKTPNASSSSYVECTSCHNPHNNEWGNFLVQSNFGSAICLNCHNKTGYETNGNPSATSAHYISTVSYAPSGGTGSTVGGTNGVKCMGCHFPHKAGGSGTPPNLSPQPDYGKYLLAFQKDATCFNMPNRWNDSINVCHSTGSPSKDIKTDIDNSGSHKYIAANYFYRHGATEHRDPSTGNALSNWVNAGGTSARWHVECSDCHNAHTAGTQSHNSPLASGMTITAISPLYGTGGVNPSWPGAWQPPSSYAYIEQQGAHSTNASSVQYEYQICFKCHSDFAWSSSPPAILNLPGISNLTNQALEFNPNNVTTNNASSHPVTTVNPNTYGTYVLPWTNGSQMMYCSDCHTRNGGGSPKGSHGSSNKAILFANFDDTYSTTKSAAQLNSDLCFTCHQQNVYLNGAEVPGSGVTGFMTSATGTNLHTRHANLATSATSSFAYRCVNCHTKIPHGYNRRAMIVVSGDTGESTYAANDVYGYARISSFTFSGAQAYSSSSCLTIAGCH